MILLRVHSAQGVSNPLAAEVHGAHGVLNPLAVEVHSLFLFANDRFSRLVGPESVRAAA